MRRFVVLRVLASLPVIGRRKSWVVFLWCVRVASLSQVVVFQEILAVLLWVWRMFDLGRLRSALCIISGFTTWVRSGWLIVGEELDFGAVGSPVQCGCVWQCSRLRRRGVVFGVTGWGLGWPWFVFYGLVSDGGLRRLFFWGVCWGAVLIRLWDFQEKVRCGVCVR